MPTTLSELFAAPRGELQVVTKLMGVSLFTSDTLKRNYLVAMAKTGKTAPVFKTISDLLQKNILTPVYSTDKILKSIRKKQPVQVRDFAGLVTEDKKIYIFVETDANIFSFTSNDDLATVTIHELIHYISSFYPKEFYSIFKNDLEDFYRFYYTKLLSCNPSDINKKSIESLVNFIHFNLEANSFIISNNLLKEYYDIISETFKSSSTLSNERFSLVVTEIMVFIKVLQKLAEVGASENFIKVIQTYKHIISPLYTTYKHVKAVNPMDAKSLCFQELWSTSEVIAIPAMVKDINPKVYRAINKL